MPAMPDLHIAQLDVFDDAPTRVVCMEEYLSLIADEGALASPGSARCVAADVTEWDGEIPIRVEGESAA